MKITEISIYSFNLPLNKTINVSTHSINSRTGFLLIITDEKGNPGYGEVSPLPGPDTDSLENCLDELIKFKKNYLNMEIDILRFNLESPLLGLAPVLTKFNNSTLFGIESALLLLALKTEGDLNIAHNIIPNTGLEIELNGLFFPDKSDEDAKGQIAYLKKNKFKTVKIKIGRIPKNREIDQIIQLWRGFNRDIQLRLDGNRSITFDLYKEYYESLKDVNIEYVEEPLKQEEKNRAIEVSWPIALDESLGEYTGFKKPILDTIPQGIRSIILKPGSLWGLHSLFRIINAANLKNINCVLSSAFNSGITISILVILAGTVKKRTAHGLDTYKYLEYDILNCRLQIKNSSLRIPEEIILGRGIINYNILNGIIT